MPLQPFPEVFLSHRQRTKQVAYAVKKGKIRKIGPRLYTTNLKDAPETLIKKHLWNLVSEYFPNGLISDRTALENAPAKDGSIFLISKRKRDVVLPGYRLKPRPGIPPQETDYPFIGTLKICSQARAFLENAKLSRERAGNVSRTLTRKELEERLETLLVKGGEAALNKLREEMKDLSLKLGLKTEYQKVDLIIGALLGTKEAPLTSKIALARRQGNPYDSERIVLFQKLYSSLKNLAPQHRLRLHQTQQERIHLAFFEAYFSNFIEGTEFAVEEAKNIIFQGYVPLTKPEDAHDILGTFQIVSSLDEMSKEYHRFEDFIELLKNRHRQIMSSRQDKKPGDFKDKINRAGSTTFVDPTLVRGTLLKGYDMLRSIDVPFQRAVFLMVVLTEVHPFLDGNGRIARIMMNGELVRANEYPILIPTIYRTNYLSALKALSQSALTEPIIRTLDFAQKYTSSIDWSDFKTSWKQLERTNAFLDPHVADLEGIRLRIE